MKIKDSGNRREFESGAVRDIAEGKGRCDLLPLLDVAKVLYDGNHTDNVLSFLSNYVETGDTRYVVAAINYFNREVLGWDNFTAILEVAKQYEEGAKKYSDRNWEKGIPLHCYLDSGVRHYLKFLRGDNDEPHHRAFIWNMLGLMWTQRNKPELNDLPFGEVKSDE